ncbi:hypothetical protein ABZ614_42870 [Streptomyces sp. NPDC013178]|uniref:hypothetical protein n=1 Tax=Streptomyces sp. NPDC013178 TaxID=3155118 RepID=UPI00340F85C6
MKYQQRLQVAVRERLRKLMTAPYSSAGHEVHLAVTWIKSQPALRGLLEEATRAEPGLDYDRFRAGLDGDMQFIWCSRTEEGRATLIWRLIQDIAKGEAANPYSGWRIASGYSNKRNIQDSWREFAEDILQPFFDYLSERVGAESSILHTLERYRTRIEWFDREELYTRCGGRSGARTSSGAGQGDPVRPRCRRVSRSRASPVQSRPGPDGAGATVRRPGVRPSSARSDRPSIPWVGATGRPRRRVVPCCSRPWVSVRLRLLRVRGVPS